MTMVFAPIRRGILIADLSAGRDCPYEQGKPRWESETWKRCAAKRIAERSAMITNIGDAPDKNESEDAG